MQRVLAESLICRGEKPDRGLSQKGLRQTMAPGRTGDEGLTVEEVERLGVRRLAEIVVKHCYRDEGLLQTVRILRLSFRTVLLFVIVPARLRLPSDDDATTGAGPDHD